MRAVGTERGGLRPRRAAGAGQVISMLPDAPDVERAALGPDGVLVHIRPDPI
jgi:3-hydroxyisobutyrate dehydrogenase-like beta-hydroxyacid dehydrogenase